MQSIINSGFIPGKDFNLCLDVAANEIYNGQSYVIENNTKIDPDGMISYYEQLTSKYPIKSIEDPIFEDDWIAWKN